MFPALGGLWHEGRHCQKTKKILKIFCQIFIVNISVSEPSIEKILKFFCRNWITHHFKTITLFFGAEFDDFRKIKTPPKRSVWGLFKLISLIFFFNVESLSYKSRVIQLRFWNFSFISAQKTTCHNMFYFFRRNFFTKIKIRHANFRYFLSNGLGHKTSQTLDQKSKVTVGVNPYVLLWLAMNRI